MIAIGKRSAIALLVSGVIGLAAFTWPLFVAPVLWSMIGLQAAFLFGVIPDLGLGVAGLAGIALALRSRGRTPRVAHA